MTGPEHYAEAERLLTLRADEGVAPDVTHARAALAQVHATLAGVYAHNRAQTELMGLLHTMLDQIRELRESGETP